MCGGTPTALWERAAAFRAQIPAKPRARVTAPRRSVWKCWIRTMLSSDAPARAQMSFARDNMARICALMDDIKYGCRNWPWRRPPARFHRPPSGPTTTKRSPALTAPGTSAYLVERIAPATICLRVAPASLSASTLISSRDWNCPTPGLETGMIEIAAGLSPKTRFQTLEERRIVLRMHQNRLVPCTHSGPMTQRAPAQVEFSAR